MPKVVRAARSWVTQVAPLLATREARVLRYVARVARYDYGELVAPQLDPIDAGQALGISDREFIASLRQLQQCLLVALWQVKRKEGRDCYKIVIVHGTRPRMPDTL